MHLRLLHHPLDPHSRLARLVLLEKNMAHDLVYAEPWAEVESLGELNPAGTLPILLAGDLAEKHVVCPASVIIEYLDEISPTPSMLGTTTAQRLETRRLISWFCEKFYAEVTHALWYEKAYKKLAGLGGPDSHKIRTGYAALTDHMSYLSWLLERRNWLAGDDFSAADLAAAAQLSVMDYSGDVTWSHFDDVRAWYSRIKSRPTFRPLLADRVPGLPPAAHYANLDFE
ncbi:MAG: glutathione S-transferase family protein [Alphaproteobacteria bacterium]|nr:glutathione S-transferase family protein [Alphaproteobacteria bacterium]